MSRSLAEWLKYQEHVNVHSIELGLDRVREVWQRMGAARPAPRVITVGGTNGKGSTVGLLEAMTLDAGLRVGAFTSPHVLRYNERVHVDGREVDDAHLVAAFERIEAARGAIPLTYFEFGTLAALDVFARADVGGRGLDLALLEVGLGGRLDAVNIVDADVAVITTVDLDHMEWLGPDRDSIGREKACIARAGRPAIVGQMDPPDGLLDTLRTIGARVERSGIDFRAERHARGWTWSHRDGSVLELPDPALAAPVQWENAASAVAALHALPPTAAWPGSAALVTAERRGLRDVRVPARLENLGGDPCLVVDVGHNPQAARVLAAWLDGQPRRRVHAVYGAMADKDVAGVLAALGSRVTQWHLGGLDGATPRGMSIAALRDVLSATLPSAPFDAHSDIETALAAAQAVARPGECILAFGSFYVARAVLTARMDGGRADVRAG